MRTILERELCFQEIAFLTLAGFLRPGALKRDPKRAPKNRYFWIFWSPGLAWPSLASLGLPLASPGPPFGHPWPPFGLSWPLLGIPLASLGLSLASFGIPLASLCPPLGSFGSPLAPLWRPLASLGRFFGASMRLLVCLLSLSLGFLDLLSLSLVYVLNTVADEADGGILNAFVRQFGRMP